MNDTKREDRDKTNEIASFVTYLNVERFLEHQLASLEEQIQFLSTAADRIKAAIARKTAVAAALEGARTRREQSERTVPMSVVNALMRGQEEIGSPSPQLELPLEARP